MLPPSDSFLHQSHKLAEVTANMRNQLASAAPPPPYSRGVPHVSNQEETLSDMDMVDDDDQFETYPGPITVHIDASINVVGHGNTIAIPSTTSAQPGASASPGNVLFPSPSPSSPASLLQSAQKQRQANLTELATSIIAALQDSDLLARGESGRHAPVEININTGIKVEGNRNVICVGVPSRMLGKKNGQTVQKDQTVVNEAVERKRRAQSEPIEMPESKTGRCV